MSEERPDVELSPTEVKLRASSGNSAIARFPVRPENSETLQNFYSHVTNVTAITPETATAMIHVSNNNLQATSIIEQERTKRAQTRERYSLVRFVVGVVFLLCAMLGFGSKLSSTGLAIVLSGVLSLFGGQTIVEKILAARRPEDPPPPMTPLPGA